MDWGQATSIISHQSILSPLKKITSMWTTAQHNLRPLLGIAFSPGPGRGNRSSTTKLCQALLPAAHPQQEPGKGAGVCAFPLCPQMFPYNSPHNSPVEGHVRS